MANQLIVANLLLPEIPRIPRIKLSEHDRENNRPRLYNIKIAV